MSLSRGALNRTVLLEAHRGPIEDPLDDLAICFAAFLGVWLGIPRAWQSVLESGIRAMEDLSSCVRAGAVLLLQPCRS